MNNAIAQTVSRSNGDSPSIDQASVLPAETVAKVTSSVATVEAKIARVDYTSVSLAATFLNQVDSQLTKTPAADLSQVLNSAASKVYAQAQSENDPTQAQALQNLADRLQDAAAAGPAALPPYSLASLLG